MIFNCAPQKMTDRNKMLQGNVMPVPVVGAISGKGLLDVDLTRQFRANSINPRTKPFCYPGGEDLINANIMQYDTCIALRNVYQLDGFDGEPAELCIVGLGGLNWSQYCSQRAMQDDYRWVGIVTTESRLINPYDPSQDDATHQGFGFIHAGTHTVPNNGGHNFYPGQRIRWRFPLAPFHPRAGASGTGEDSDMPVLNQLARAGRPPTQWTVEYVPFDPMDVTEQMAAAFAAITSPYAHGGISDLTYANAVPSLTGYPGVRPHSCLQEESISYKYGIAGIGMAFVNALADLGAITINIAAPFDKNPADDTRQANFQRCAELAKKLGLWKTNEDKQDALHQVLAEVFLGNISPLDKLGADARDAFEKAKEGSDDRSYAKIAFGTPENKFEKYASLRVHAMQIMLQGIHGSWDSTHNYIVGRALNASAPGDDLHGLWGHFC